MRDSMPHQNTPLDQLTDASSHLGGIGGTFEVLGPDPRNTSSVVCYLFSLCYVRIEHNCPGFIHQADSSQRRSEPAGSNADHLAVDGEDSRQGGGRGAVDGVGAVEVVVVVVVVFLISSKRRRRASFRVVVVVLAIAVAVVAVAKGAERVVVVAVRAV